MDEIKLNKNILKKKVLFILPSLDAGGAENYALRYIKHKGNNEMEWHVKAPNKEKSDLYEAFKNEGVKIKYQTIGYFNLNKLLEFKKYLEFENFDVVCTFTGNFGGLPITVAKWVGVKKRIAWHRRSTDAFSKKNYFKRLYNYFVYNLVKFNATDILSNSKFALDNFYGNSWRNNSKYDIIPNGLDSSFFDNKLLKNDARKILSLPNDVFIVGHVGRYDPAKNHDTIFRVIKNLKAKKVIIKFLFCGKETDSAEFKFQLDKYNINDYVIIMGLSKQLPIVYKSLDLFFFPSVTEGQPNALIEAMLSGLPVLSSTILPIKECTPVEIHPNLLDSKDVNGFENAILKAMEKPNISNIFNREFAVKKFDSNKNFELFTKKILN
jgi:glycosyltransferase involved in cell wall biosynthesis